MKSKPLPGVEVLSTCLILLLSSIVLLGSSSGPPTVEISSVDDIEDGTTIRVVGILVDLRLYDSGAEGLILADLDDGTVVKVVSMPGINVQPSSYLRVGDEVLVTGEVSASESSPVIFSSSDDLRLQRKSEMVLTVESLARNWHLFDGDIVRVKGVLDSSASGGGLRLYDCSSGTSIAVLHGDADAGRFVGCTVTLTATLQFNTWLGALTLVPSYIVPEQ